MATDAASGRAAALQLAATGELSGAFGLLREVAEESDDPEDRLLLGTMAFLLTDVAEAQEQLGRAYRGFQARRQPRRAAMAATMLGRVHYDMLDDKIVGRAWLARALRLLEREEPCVEKGYVLVGLFGAYIDSAEELEANARIALDIAHEFQDPNLECKALGDSGLALVSIGRVREGMQRRADARRFEEGRDYWQLNFPPDYVRWAEEHLVAYRIPSSAIMASVTRGSIASERDCSKRSACSHSAWRELLPCSSDRTISTCMPFWS